MAVAAYRLTDRGALARDYSLKDQMRRAAVSVCSNIAEGDEHGTNRDCVRFLYIAKGSLAELRTLLDIAREVGYLEQAEHARHEEQAAELGRMLGSLIKVRSQTTRPRRATTLDPSPSPDNP